MYYQLSQPGATGWLMPLVPMHWTLPDNIKRDPFEQATGLAPKSAAGLGGTLAAPSTAFMYDWNMLPIGQQLWFKWLETLREFPPMQTPASYNLEEVEAQIRASGAGHASE